MAQGLSLSFIIVSYTNGHILVLLPGLNLQKSGGCWLRMKYPEVSLSLFLKVLSELKIRAKSDWYNGYPEDQPHCETFFYSRWTLYPTFNFAIACASIISSTSFDYWIQWWCETTIITLHSSIEIESSSTVANLHTSLLLQKNNHSNSNHTL